MEDLMSRISGNLALREALCSQLGMSSASTGDPLNHVSGTNTSVTSPVSSQSSPGSSTTPNISVSTSMDQQRGAADIQLVDNNYHSNSNDSPLVVRVYQSGANITDPLDARVYRGDVNKPKMRGIK